MVLRLGVRGEGLERPGDLGGSHGARRKRFKDEGRYLFSYGGQNASNYYQEMALSMAAKLGGPEVLTKIDSLEEGAFEQDAIVQAYDAMAEAVEAGYFEPGGEGIKHTDAQTNWVTGTSVFYPSGSWIENEQADVTPEGYDMTGAPVPSLPDSTMPHEAFHGTAAEQYFVPLRRREPHRWGGAAARHALQGAGAELRGADQGPLRSSRTPCRRTASARRRWPR